jgi:hypothetical protein
MHDDAVGWCQVGPRDRLPKLRNQYGLERDSETWAVTCFYVKSAVRRAGVARALRVRALDDMQAFGVSRVDAFPKRGHDIGELWNGPEALFLEQGFSAVKDDVLRPVLALDLA